MTGTRKAAKATTLVTKPAPGKNTALATARPAPTPGIEHPEEATSADTSAIADDEVDDTSSPQEDLAQSSSEDDAPSDSEEEVASTESTVEPAETEEEIDAETALTFGGKGSDKASQAAALDKLVKEAIESADYLTLRSTLEESIKRSYPKIFEGNHPSVKKKGDKKTEEEETTQEGDSACVLAHLDVKKLKVKDKIGQRAIALCYCLDLLLENDSSHNPNQQKSFMTFLLTGKKKNYPADTFLAGIIHHRVEKEFAAEMLTDLSSFYRDKPEKAYREINRITASRAARINKRYYPVAKKDIEKEIERILKTKPSDGADEAQQEAINLANVYRFICGVKPSLKYDKKFGAEAEDAAAACKKAGRISHDLGHSTNACNLHQGMDTRAKSVPGYIHDPGESNRSARLHRFWVLDPNAAKTAFGQSGVFHAMRVADKTSGWTPPGGYSYPGRGYFPVRYLHGDGWSYYAPPGKSMGQKPEVEMWRLSRSPRDLVNQSDLRKSRRIPIRKIYPNGGFVVFEPDYSASAMRSNESGQPDGVYWIRVRGDGFSDEYLVEFY